MLAPARTAPPASTPVSLDEAKRHLVVDSDDDDALITSFIEAAVDHFDGWSGILGRALVTQSWRQDFGGFGGLRLPVGPVASITKVEYFDGGNAIQTVPDTIYTFRTDARGSYVALAPDQAWPSACARPDAVSVTYVAGTAAADVPAAIKTAILLMVGHFYANREAVGEVRSALPLGVHALLAPYRRVGV